MKKSRCMLNTMINYTEVFFKSRSMSEPYYGEIKSLKIEFSNVSLASVKYKHRLNLRKYNVNFFLWIRGRAVRVSSLGFKGPEFDPFGGKNY